MIKIWHKTKDELPQEERLVLLCRQKTSNYKFFALGSLLNNEWHLNNSHSINSVSLHTFNLWSYLDMLIDIDSELEALCESSGGS